MIRAIGAQMPIVAEPGRSPTRKVDSPQFELVRADVLRAVNVPTENLHPLIMIECARLVLPVRTRNHRDLRRRRLSVPRRCQFVGLIGIPGTSGK